MIAQGDFVLLRAAGGREYFASVRDDKLHTDLGIVDLKQLEGMDWGSVIESHLGKPFTILKPRAPDFFKHIKRTGAPMMPKDIGVIIAYTGVSPSDVILDAGTGSGVLAIYLGTIARKVITYEINEQFVNVARKNVSNAGLSNVEVRQGNIVEEISEHRGPVRRDHAGHAGGRKSGRRRIPATQARRFPGHILPVLRADHRGQVLPWIIAGFTDIITSS